MIKDADSKKEDPNQFMFTVGGCMVGSEDWQFEDSFGAAYGEAKAQAIDCDYDSFIVAKAIRAGWPKVRIADDLLEQLDEDFYEETGYDDFLFEGYTRKEYKPKIADLNQRVQDVFEQWAAEHKITPPQYYMPAEEVVYSINPDTKAVEIERDNRK